MNEDLADAVLTVVELIPPGRVLAYGKVALIAGTGARQVGTILRLYGSDVPWWRVPGHDGTFAPALLARARDHWRREGIALSPSGRGCRYREFEADADDVARRFAQASG